MEKIFKILLVLSITVFFGGWGLMQYSINCDSSFFIKSFVIYALGLIAILFFGFPLCEIDDSSS